MTQIPSLAVAADGRTDAELLVVGCLQGVPPEVDSLPAAVRQAVLGIAGPGGRRGWAGREEQVAQASPGAGGPVVTLYGLGAASELTFGKLTRWMGRVADEARANGVRRLAVALPRHAETTGEAAARRVTRALGLASYRFERYRSEPDLGASADGDHGGGGASGDGGRLEAVDVVPPPGAAGDYTAGLEVARTLAEAVVYSRDLANTPGNDGHPQWLEDRARDLAASHGLDLVVLDVGELERRRMGGLLAVGAGSQHPPRLLRLSWRADSDGGGKANAKPKRPVALVGKGVTFDTGGISIKPAADMEQMKFDKAGACAVLGAMRAVAELGLDVPVRAYLPVAENMLNGAAYRPGDIVRCYNGRTVEITNTDAEGRMILADAMAWAVEEGAATLLELSTLTGACVVALGHHAAGLFSPDDELAAQLTAAAADGGERLWRLPMLPEFLDEMKALHADLRNSASRWGGASTAAAFLSQFVGSLSAWAHLDIAGVAYARSEDGRGTAATGFGVTSVVEWLRRHAG